MRRGEILRRSQPHEARDRGFRELADHFIREREDPPPIAEQGFAGVRQTEVARVAVDQAAAERLFEALQLEAYGGLAEMQAFRRARQVSDLGGCDEGAQEIIVEAVWHRPIISISNDKSQNYLILHMQHFRHDPSKS